VNVPGILIAALGPAGLAGLLWRLDRHYSFRLGWFSGGAGGALGYIAGRAWVPALLCAANALIAALAWWWRRRKRRRAARLIGARSRALLAAVVARMRETAKPRPVLRPSPGGAHG